MHPYSLPLAAAPPLPAGRRPSPDPLRVGSPRVAAARVCVSSCSCEFVRPRDCESEQKLRLWLQARATRIGLDGLFDELSAI
jgi:hypothetical protein